MNNPKVSIIIVNYCGKELLEECLKSLSNTSFKSYEVIVVDNNSNDGSEEFLSRNYPSIQVITLNKNYGFAIPNNIGAKVAKGKYLVFLNNDTTITPMWLDELVKALENDKTIVMAQSLLLQPDGSVDSSGDFIDSLGRAYSKHDLPQKKRYILSPRAACMITRKDVFLDLEGFDENYFASFEDVQLGWKAWLWGYKITLVPSSIVYHKGGQTVQKVSKIVEFHGAKNNLLLRITNFDFSDSIKSIFLMATIILMKKFFGISLAKNSDQRFNIPEMRTLLKAGFWILKNTGKVSKKRRLLKSRKVRTNAELRKMGLITEFRW